MTQIVINQIKNELKVKKLERENILICGLTYKKDVADIRNSLSLKIFKKIKNKFIQGYDPLIDKKFAKENKLIYKKKDFSKFKVYILLTKHTILEKSFKKLKNKIIIRPI